MKKMHEESIPHAPDRSRAVRLCSNCEKPGHYRQTCPERDRTRLVETRLKRPTHRAGYVLHDIAESAPPVVSAAIVRAKALEALRARREELRKQMQAIEEQIERVDEAVAVTLDTFRDLDDR